MSALAAALPAPGEVAGVKGKPGPKGACAVYGMGDQEDWTAVDALRRQHDWKTARAVVHSQLGLGSPSPNGDQFRYHWRGKCGCWSGDLKEWIEARS